MKTTKFTCFFLLILTGTVLFSRAEPYRTDINPAMLYYRAFLMPWEPMSETNRNYLSTKQGKEQKLPERFGQIVANHDNQFELVRRAAHATVPCDWGIDFSDGPNIMLPHLGRAKVVCQIAQLRAVWDLQNGRQDDARDDMLAAFVLGRNVASDPITISALVQYAIEAIEYSTVAQYFSEFSPETLKQLVNGFDAAPPRHTIAACIPSEKTGINGWVLNKILELQKAHPNDDAKVMANLHEMTLNWGVDTNFWPRILAASGGTSEGAVKLLHETEPLYARLAELMALPEPEYEIQKEPFFADCQKSPNPFIVEFVLGLEKTRSREFRVQAQLAMVHAAVEYKLHGESGLKSVMDPFGNGPFGFQRFVFKGVDRGFELKSAYAGTDAPFVMIFVEKEGPAFQITGPDAGKAIDK